MNNDWQTDYSKSEANLPGPLFILLGLFDSENHPFSKVRRLTDALEWAMKWHTVLTMADMFREFNLTTEIKVLLANGLRTPSLGIWNLFFRKSMASIKNPLMPWKDLQKMTFLEQRHNLVQIRNQYSHGAKPHDRTCLDDIERIYPVLLQLINSPLFTDILLIHAGPHGFQILQGSEQRPFTSVDERCLSAGHAGALLPGGAVLDFWPFAFFHQIQESSPEWNFFYFNALRGKQVEQLNYEIPAIRRDPAIWKAFHDFLPLNDWRGYSTASLEHFRSTIDDLTDAYKGRLTERNVLKKFCLSGQGSLMVFGGPGIGKSALLAKVLREVRASFDVDDTEQGEQSPPVIEYFIRRQTPYASVNRFLHILCDRLDSLFGLPPTAKGQSLNDLLDSLAIRFQEIEERNIAKRLVLLIDGLDEAPELLPFIPESRSWLVFAFGSRRIQTVESFYGSRKPRQQMELAPLANKDIRALLYEVVNKYDANFTESYIQAVADRSQGNPQYLKLLSEQLFSGAQKVGDVHTLPQQFNKLLKDYVDRVTGNSADKRSLSLLYLLAEAKTSLSCHAIAEFLDIDEIEALSTVDACRELLVEDALTPEVEDYQLFHESLREWLHRTAPQECRQMAERLADLCFQWQSRTCGDAIRYALQFGPSHLMQVNRRDDAWALIREDREFIRAKLFAQHMFYSFTEDVEQALLAEMEAEGEGWRACLVTALRSISDELIPLYLAVLKRIIQQTGKSESVIRQALCRIIEENTLTPAWKLALRMAVQSGYADIIIAGVLHDDSTIRMEAADSASQYLQQCVKNRAYADLQSFLGTWFSQFYGLTKTITGRNKIFSLVNACLSLLLHSIYDKKVSELLFAEFACYLQSIPLLLPARSIMLRVVQAPVRLLALHLLFRAGLWGVALKYNGLWKTAEPPPDAASDWIPPSFDAMFALSQEDAANIKKILPFFLSLSPPDDYAILADVLDTFMNVSSDTPLAQMKQTFSGCSMYTLLQHNYAWCRSDAIERWFRTSWCRNVRMGLLSGLGYRAQELQTIPEDLHAVLLKYTKIYFREFRHEACEDYRTLGAIDSQFANIGYCEAKMLPGKLFFLDRAVKECQAQKDLPLLAKLFRDLLPVGISHPESVLDLLRENVDLKTGSITLGTSDDIWRLSFEAVVADKISDHRWKECPVHCLLMTLGTLKLVHDNVVDSYWELHELNRNDLYLAAKYEDRQRLAEFRDKRQIQRAGNFLSYRFEGIRHLVLDSINFAIGICDRKIQRTVPPGSPLLTKKDMRRILFFLLSRAVALVERQLKHVS